MKKNYYVWKQDYRTSCFKLQCHTSNFISNRFIFYDVSHKLLSWRKLSQRCELNSKPNKTITCQEGIEKMLFCNYIQKNPLNPTSVAALPSFRVSCEHAFENVGVDFVGSLYYNVSNNEIKKCYIFVIHLCSFQSNKSRLNFWLWYRFRYLSFTEIHRIT